MIKITVWYRITKDEDTQEEIKSYNHFEYGWVDNDKPLPKKPEFVLQKAWSNYEWKKGFEYLDGNRIIQ